MTTTEAKKKGKAAAQEMIDNLSEKELAELKDSFKSAFLAVVKTQKDKLAKLKKDLDEKEKKYVDVREKGRVAVYPESQDLFEKKMKLGEEIGFLKSEIMNQENCVQAVENRGGIVELTDEKEKVHKNIADFREVNTNQIEFDLDSILTAQPPVYVPRINEDTFRHKGYLFDAIRVTNDSYIVAINGYKEDKPTFYVILTLDQLVLVQDYYYTKAKAKNLKDAEDKNKRNEEHWDNLSPEKREKFLNQTGLYHSLPAKEKKKITKEEFEALTWQEKEKIHKFYKRYRAKRLTSKLRESYMWVSFHKMYERFKNPKATQPDARHANAEAFNYWAAFREMMEYKILDIQIQRQDLSENYKTALETSFGESNTSDILKDELGILVKRQNGEKIKAPEIDQIREAVLSVQKIFGNLKPNFEKYNIKFSHTGTRYVFASKAIGVYYGDMGTISVSDKYGDNEFKMTAAHEIGHFIDNKIGELNGKRYATDDYEGIAGQIAFTFRNNMNKPKSEQTQYINATKECFARALEQFYGVETFGEEAGITFSYHPLDKFRPFFVADDFVSKKAYYEEIRPLVIQFFEENKDILEYTYDIDESNEPIPVGNEEETQQKVAIESLEALLTVSSGKDEKEIKEAIEAIKVLQGLGTKKMEDGGVIETELKYDEVETGKPISFYSLHTINKEKTPDYGERFGQHIEPKGKYLSSVPNSSFKLEDNERASYHYGVTTFQNPLVIEFKNTGATGWKKDLYDTYGKKGKKLSQHLVKLGYDGIITRDKESGYVMEIISLQDTAKIMMAQGGELSYKHDTHEFQDNLITYVVDGKKVGELDYQWDKNGISDNIMGSEMYIGYVSVDKEFRGQGIATKLLRKAIEDARQIGIDYVTLKRDSGMGCSHGSAYDNYLKSIYSNLGFLDTYTEEEADKNPEANICAMHLDLRNQKMAHGDETQKSHFIFVIKNISNPEEIVSGGIKNKYKGSYKKIFKILNEGSVFMETNSIKEEMKGKDFYITLEDYPDADKIEKISKIKNVKILEFVEEIKKITDPS